MGPDQADVLREMLRAAGLDPCAVTSPAAAWPVFREFLLVEVDGPDPLGGFSLSWWRGPDRDPDGLPRLSFSRRLGYSSPGTTGWELELEMVFAADLDPGEQNTQSSGTYPVSTGSEMDAAVSEALWEIRNCSGLRALWTGAPRWSAVGLRAEHPHIDRYDTFDEKQRAAYIAHRAAHG
jgi:hypothetical protein